MLGLLEIQQVGLSDEYREEGRPVRDEVSGVMEDNTENTMFLSLISTQWSLQNTHIPIFYRRNILSSQENIFHHIK